MDVSGPIQSIIQSQGTGPLTNDQTDELIDDLVRSIQVAVDHSTPELHISPRSRPGFTEECKEAQMRYKRLKRR